MSERLRTFIEQAGDDWYVTVKLDDYVIFEECCTGEYAARAEAGEFRLILCHDLTENDEVVICAAVLADNGEVLRCHRHHDGLRALADRQLEPAEHERAQGFVTSRNRYVDRKEAMQLQLAAGIASASPGGYRGSELFSEDLY